MRTFFFDLLISIIGTIVLWQFGLASRIWPAHPLLATTLIVAACAIATHRILSRDAQSKRSVPPAHG